MKHHCVCAILQHLYYLFESVIILFLVVFGQQAGELLFPFRRTCSVLWGGIFCAMTWGMLHGLTKDVVTWLMPVLQRLFLTVAGELPFCKETVKSSRN